MEVIVTTALDSSNTVAREIHGREKAFPMFMPDDRGKRQTVSNSLRKDLSLRSRSQSYFDVILS
jgi:hypothetical protein